ncbi:unnamed protein product [Candida parapsilosis]
MVSHYTTRSRS